MERGVGPLHGGFVRTLHLAEKGIQRFRIGQLGLATDGNVSPGLSDLPGRAVFQTGCQAPFAKIFCFSEDPNHLYIPRRPVPQRGVAQRHETRGGMRWTLLVPVTNGAKADGEGVWS